MTTAVQLDVLMLAVWGERDPESVEYARRIIRDIEDVADDPDRPEEDAILVAMALDENCTVETLGNDHPAQSVDDWDYKRVRFTDGSSAVLSHHSIFEIRS